VNVTHSIVTVSAAVGCVAIDRYALAVNWLDV